MFTASGVEVQAEIYTEVHVAATEGFNNGFFAMETVSPPTVIFCGVSGLIRCLVPRPFTSGGAGQAREHQWEVSSDSMDPQLHSNHQ